MALLPVRERMAARYWDSVRVPSPPADLLLREGKGMLPKQ